MGAGQPNWQKLHEMGKLPKEARAKIGMLGENDRLEERLGEVEAGVCDDCRTKLFPRFTAAEPALVNAIAAGAEASVKCEAEGCEYVAKGRTDGMARNTLRMHSKKHEQKP